VHVLHVLGLACGDVVVRYVHAAGKGHGVAHQHLAVVAQVYAEIGRKQARRHEQGHAHPTFGKLFPRFAQGIEHADAVHQHAGVHTALRSTGKGLAKGRCNLPSVENVGAEKNMVLGIVYGCEHCGVGLIAVAQRGDGIAGAQVLLGEHSPDVFHAGYAVRDIFRWNLGKGRMGVIRLQRLLPPHDAAGPAFCPADAKAGIQNRAYNRQKQGRDRPAKGRAGVMFGQQCVADGNPRKYVGDNEAQGFKK